MVALPPKKPLGSLGFGPPNLFVFLVGYNLQSETSGVVFSMVDHTIAQFVIGLLWISPSWGDSLIAELPVRGLSKISEPQNVSHFLSYISLPIFVPTSHPHPSPPIYTLLLVGQSWWRNLWHVSGSLHSQGFGSFFSLDHCSFVPYHVSERGPIFYCRGNSLVTRVRCRISCLVDEFSKGSISHSQLT